MKVGPSRVNEMQRRVGNRAAPSQIVPGDVGCNRTASLSGCHHLLRRAFLGHLPFDCCVRTNSPNNHLPDAIGQPNTGGPAKRQNHARESASGRYPKPHHGPSSKAARANSPARKAKGLHPHNLPSMSGAPPEPPTWDERTSMTPSRRTGLFRLLVAGFEMAVA
jgi:hypothetical protein